MRKYKIAVIQLDSQNDKMKNLQAVATMIERAVKENVQIVSLPEDMNLVGENIGTGGKEEDIPGLTTDFLSQLAVKYQIYIHSGSFKKRIPGDSRFYNTSVLLTPEGEILAEYHKMHTFDITMVDGTESKESEQIKPGDRIVVEKTELGNLGFSICYDIRFPELYRLMALQGAEVIFTPANFTDGTGVAHWETILRTRAIENGCYIVAADQCGNKPAYPAHGNSMIIDPWGNILARAGQNPEIIYAEIDLDMVHTIRAKIPSLKNRRCDLYDIIKK